MEKKIMSNQATIQKNDKGWIIEIPDEFAENIGIEKKSIGLLSYQDGQIKVEILPPPTVDLEKSIDRVLDKYQDAFAEMKRLGD